MVGTTPTSQHTIKKNQQAEPVIISAKRISIWQWLLLILVSAVAGFGGAYLWQHYPSHWPGADKILVNEESNSQFPEVVFLDQGEDKSKTELVDILQAHQSKTIVTVFPGSTDSFQPEQQLGKGVIVSADGWVVILGEVLQKQTSVSLVLEDGRVFISNDIVTDPFSGVVFVHIEASQLPVADFRNSEVELGEEIILYTTSVASGDRISVGYIENTNFNDDLEFSTLHTNTQYLIDYPAREEYLGSPVFDKKGAMIGFNLLDHKVLPIEVVSGGLYSLFTNETIERHTMDIGYEPLYRGVDPDSESRKQGVRVTRVGSGVKNLQVGDVITEVNGQKLDQEHDLSIVLSELELNSKVKFSIRRNGVSKTVELEIE